MISKTKPYVYIVKYEPTKQYYIGVKFAVGCSPETFWVDDGYYTSSPTIHTLILENGEESFTIKRIRIFNTPEEAYSYETRLLRRVRARTNPKFLNKHENEAFPFGSRAFKEMILEKYGVDNVSKAPEIKEKKRQSAIEKYGVDNVSKSPEVKQKISETFMKKYGFAYAAQHPDVIAKRTASQSRLALREEVSVIKQYVKRDRLKLGRGWYQRSTSDLQKMISEFVEKYGPL